LLTLEGRMHLKILAILLIFIFSTFSYAGIYIGGFGGKLAEKGDEEFLLSGSVAGGKIGYRKSWFGIEIAHSTFDLSTATGVTDIAYVEKMRIYGSVTDLIFRLSPFQFLTFGFGFSGLSQKSDIRLNDIGGDPSMDLVYEKPIFKSGTILTAGLQIPLFGGLEIFGEYVARKWIADSDDLVGMEDLDLTGWQAGLLWHFDGGGPRRRARNDDSGSSSNRNW